MAGMSASLIQALDLAESLPQAEALRARTYSFFPPGARVVDVGCGTGRAVAEMTEKGLDALGIDVSADMIDAATSRWPGDFRVGDACSLPLADGEVTGYRADKVVHALDDPALALAEARRVLAPGGRIVLLGQDWDACMVDSSDPVRTRALIHARADTIPHPRIARSYRNLLLDNGFRNVTVEAHTALFTDPAMLPLVATISQDPDWLADQRARAEADRFLVALPMFLAAGERPE